MNIELPLWGSHTVWVHMDIVNMCEICSRVCALHSDTLPTCQRIQRRRIQEEQQRLQNAQYMAARCKIKDLDPHHSKSSMGLMQERKKKIFTWYNMKKIAVDLVKKVLQKSL